MIERLLRGLIRMVEWDWKEKTLRWLYLALQHRLGEEDRAGRYQRPGGRYDRTRRR